MNKNKEFDLEATEKELKGLGVDLEKADCQQNCPLGELFSLLIKFGKEMDDTIKNQRVKMAEHKAEYLKFCQEWEKAELKQKKDK